MDEKKYRKTVMRNYIIICVALVLLSFFSLLFKEWVLPVCMAVCSLFGVVVTFLLLKTHSDAVNESDRGKLTVYMLLRYLCMTIGLVISCFIVKFTMGSEIVKTRYLMVVIAAIPYIATTFAILLTKAVDTK